ncbi:MAG: hypothetical protein ABR527_09195 [Gemmatimonadota bacterium]
MRRAILILLGVMADLAPGRGPRLPARSVVAGRPDPPEEPTGTIGLVYAVGAITSDESGYEAVFGRTMGSETMIEMLDDVAADDDLDAVGGSP